MNAKTKIEAAAAVIEYFPLADLYLSDMNPRQNADPEGIALLADSILACGLVQNLAGIRDEAGRVAIVAGGRRLRALNIAAEKSADLGLVPVRLAPDHLTAQAWANAENTAREALNPADEVRAYRRMEESGAPVPSIARAFGVTEFHVYRRLKLAHLPAPIIEALHSGRITQAIAEAFTAANDETLQLQVLDRVLGNSNTSAHQIRQLLNSENIRATDRRAMFVGKEAYEAAGGDVRGDLFSEDVFFHNPALLDQLFCAKLDQAAEDARAHGWRWIEAMPDSTYLPYGHTEKLTRLRAESPVLTEAEAEEWDTLDANDEKDRERLGELEDKTAPRFTPEQMAVSGGWVYVDSHGDLCLEAGYIRRADEAAAVEAGLMKKATAAPTDKGPFSTTLVEDMQAVRLAAVQSALLAKPQLVLDLLAFALSTESGAYHALMDIRAGSPKIIPSQEDGLKVDERLTPKPDYSRCPDLAQAFTAFRDKGQKHRNATLTASLARTLNYGCNYGASVDPIFALLEDEAGSEIRAMWVPTAANFFGRVAGSYLDDLFKDLLELDEASADLRSFRSLKKAAKAKALEAIFADPANCEWKLTADQAARVAAWMPDCY